MSRVSLRLLLRILRQQQSSFVLQRTESTLQMTDEVLQRLSPKETTLQALTEVKTLFIRQHVWCQGLNFSPRLVFTHLHTSSLPGGVRGPHSRQDEGGLPGRRQSGQCVCAELQGSLVEQDPTDWCAGGWWPSDTDTVLTLQWSCSHRSRQTEKGPTNTATVLSLCKAHQNAVK